MISLQTKYYLFGAEEFDRVLSNLLKKSFVHYGYMSFGTDVKPGTAGIVVGDEYVMEEANMKFFLKAIVHEIGHIWLANFNDVYLDENNDEIRAIHEFVADILSFTLLDGFNDVENSLKNKQYCNGCADISLDRDSYQHMFSKSHHDNARMTLMRLNIIARKYKRDVNWEALSHLIPRIEVSFNFNFYRVYREFFK